MVSERMGFGKKKIKFTVTAYENTSCCFLPPIGVPV